MVEPNKCCGFIPALDFFIFFLVAPAVRAPADAAAWLPRCLSFVLMPLFLFTDLKQSLVMQS
jgi:hypothetical protein